MEEGKPTGVMDKDGREILEGDIVETSNGKYYVVLWREGLEKFVLVDERNESTYDIPDNTKVVGTYSLNRDLLANN